MNLARPRDAASPRHKTAVLLTALSAAALSGAVLIAQSPSDTDVYTRIRQEAAARSEIMRSLHMLTDVHGPRLTGSPNARDAGDWAMKRMTEWGLQNAHAEAWSFGHPGWTNESVTAQITAPVKDQLIVEVLAWSPGTNGTIEAPAFALTLPDRASVSDLSDYLKTVDRKVAGRIVLVGRPAVVPVSLTQPPAKADESRLRAQYAQGLETASDPRNPSGQMLPFEINQRIDEFLVKNGALLRINDAGRELGQIVAFNNPQYDVTKVVSTVVMRNEDFGRIFRILADGTPATLRFNIVNRVYPEGRTSYNTIAEIPGTDKAREVVMLGGHLDSWQSATGATDNAAGCAVMMEAARILKAIGVKPRRTIRVALWTGEEQGLLGSQAYVREHFGPFESPKAEHALLSAYLNLDTGTGRIRGATVFGPQAAADRVRDWLAPFAELGVVGAGATGRRVLGLTDSGSFAAAGLPSLNFDQDPVQYETATHHTNLDTYERIIEDDVRASSIVVAALVYKLAMHDEPLPRFDRKTMPNGNWR